MDLAVNVATLLLPTARASSPRRRWRLAFTVIFSSRAFARATRGLTRVLPIPRYPSYTSVAINEPPTYPKLPRVDGKILANLVKDKNHDALRLLGGTAGVARDLATDPDLGLCDDDLPERRATFGSNTYPRPKPHGFLRFVSDAANDTMLLLLLACAAASLGLGIKEHGVKEGWYDGVSIFVAVFLVVSVTAVSNFRQDRRFRELSAVADDVRVEAVRDGRRREVLMSELVVGDVLWLKTGDQIPADALLLDGHSVQLDESSMTGETDHVAVDASGNPFLPSGTKVVDGHGNAVVTAVGADTAWGEMMAVVGQEDRELTPLQERLARLTTFIGKAGTAVAVLVLAVLVARYFAGATRDEDGNREFEAGTATAGGVASALLRIVSDALTIVVVAVPEGLPLAVTLTLAYSMKRMMKDNSMVRKLPACETMGAVTAICTDKTGTLTLNRMRVVEAFVGEEALAGNARDLFHDGFLELLHCGVAMNTTGSVYVPPSHPTAEVEVTGSPTEKAILHWAVKKLGMEMDNIKNSCTVLHMEAFNSQKKRSGVMVRRGGETYVHWKGAAEMVLAMCSSYYDGNGASRDVGSQERPKLEEVITSMAANSLRCIAFACKRVVGGSGIDEEGLTLLAVIGLKDPCRPEARAAVEACRRAGVAVKMVTGDNVHTARAIAVESGILRPEELDDKGLVVEGRAFRDIPDGEERLAAAMRIRVMARSSPADKLLMVRCLRAGGEVVAVTGDGTNDAPALKQADVGLAMGVAGTEVAKGCSDVVILDDNFGSVATVLRWGRCVYTNIQKFLQFQLTVNAAALTVNIVSAVSSGDVPLTTVQMLWVNLIMDTLGALALATERPTEELMRRPPVGRSAPLITNVMWRNVASQAAFQIGVLLFLLFAGEGLLGWEQKVRDTMVFNTFVLCQVFNEFNARRPERRNIFEGLQGNRLFVAILAGTVALQVVMVEALQRFAGTERLTWGQWGICVGIAFFSWPVGWLVKCIPVPETPLFARLRKHQDL